MKTKSIRALALFVIIMSINMLGATTASAEPIRHSFQGGNEGFGPHCDIAQLHSQGYEVLLGSQTRYAGADCWNGTSRGYAIRTIIDPNTRYICRGGIIVGKWNCGNRIEIIEEEVQQQQVAQSRGSVDVAGFFEGLITVLQYGTQLCNIGRSYGYESQYYHQACDYVRRCQHDNYPRIVEVSKTITNYNTTYVNSFNQTHIVPPGCKTPVVCPPVVNQTGLDPVIVNVGSNQQQPVKTPYNRQAATAPVQVASNTSSVPANQSVATTRQAATASIANSNRPTTALVPRNQPSQQVAASAPAQATTRAQNAPVVPANTNRQRVIGTAPTPLTVPSVIPKTEVAKAQVSRVPQLASVPTRAQLPQPSPVVRSAPVTRVPNIPTRSAAIPQASSFRSTPSIPNIRPVAPMRTSAPRAFTAPSAPRFSPPRVNPNAGNFSMRASTMNNGGHGTGPRRSR